MIYIDPRLLSPAPKHVQGVACVACDRIGKAGAKWAFYPGGNQAIPVLLCSPCFIEGWAPKQGPEFKEYLGKVEEKMGRSLVWETETRLSSEDADRILAAIAVTSRIKYSKCSS